VLLSSLSHAYPVFFRFVAFGIIKADHFHLMCSFL
jgi:hypothetical protein